MNVNLQRHKVKLNSTPQQTFKRPKPPTEEAIKRAQFVDKTYVWNKK